ncbi:MAG: hypothetical protein KGO52_15215 [Nitrospirota bacterium]|nr:hypothetical protein [Nitrospirota bacterium]MDE3244059.1 hypothetical protein [Nitrospirota bacterium]
MVGLIGLATMVALVWLLDFSMANESDAERRRIARSGTSSFADAVGQDQGGEGTRVAA